eukprot:8215786-Alexandrium_andersonii.AAC.1
MSASLVGSEMCIRDSAWGNSEPSALLSSLRPTTPRLSTTPLSLISQPFASPAFYVRTSEQGLQDKGVARDGRIGLGGQ